MPAFNDGRFIREAIDSILAQTFGDFELLIIDDGSTDDTPAILAAISDPRLRVVRNDENRGLVFTLNLGIEQSRGRYIARMDADDIAEPHRLAAQYAFLEEHAEISIAGSSRTLIDEAGRYVATAAAVPDDAGIRWKCLLGNPFAHPTVMMRRDLLLRHNLRYRDAYRAEDYDLWPRLLAVTQGANLAEPLVRYRLRHRPPQSQAQQLESHDRLALAAIRQLVPGIRITQEEVRQLRGRYGGFSVRDPGMDPKDPRWIDALESLRRHFESATKPAHAAA